MKEIVKISLPNARFRSKHKQANGNKFSHRVVFPANIPKFGSHILFISQDFVKPDPNNPNQSIMYFYAENNVELSKRVILSDGEIVYPKVTTTPAELKEAVSKKIPQMDKDKKIDEETIKTLKENVSALEYLKDVYGFSFQSTGRKYYKCEQHDSLVVDVQNNAIYWNSQGVKGSIVDFIMKVDSKSFMKAMEDLDKYYSALPQDKKTLIIPSIEEKEFSLPGKAASFSRVKNYLCKERGLDELLVNKLHEDGRIYQDTRANCVFTMQDSLQNTVGAFIRSTYSNFRGDVAGSKKTHGFFYESCPGAKKLVITESFIDALSYITLKLHNHEPIDFNVLGSDSASTINETFRINYLTRPEIHKNIDTVILAPDNDNAGTKAIESFKEFVKPFHHIEDIQVDIPNTKDWNQDLQAEKEVGISL